MKLLIFNRPKVGREQMDAMRFKKMLNALKTGGLSVEYFAIQTEVDLERIVNKQEPDLVYSANYFINDKAGKKISIHKLLKQKGIDYVGSSPESLELVLSKIKLKQKWQADGVRTPQFFKLERVGDEIRGLTQVIQNGNYPYILKPDREGNSRGLDQSSIVFDQAGLGKKIGELFASYGTVLVEQFLGNCADVHEYTVAMIGNGSKRLFLPAEIKLKRAKKVRIVTTRDKDEHLTQALPVNDSLLRERLAAFARKAFESAGVRDYSRCDVIMADGKLFAIEINGLPMIPDLWFEVCARGAALDANQYLNAIIAAGMIRTAKKRDKVTRNLAEVVAHATQDGGDALDGRLGQKGEANEGVN